jgi:hypothetical protein
MQQVAASKHICGNGIPLYQSRQKNGNIVSLLVYNGRKILEKLTPYCTCTNNTGIAQLNKCNRNIFLCSFK